MLYVFEKRISDGSFVGVFGALRSGKTLMAVRLAHLLAQHYGYQIVSNIPIRSGIKVDSLESVAGMRRVVFLWDEVQVSLDSRSWSTDGARALTQDMILWGKRQIITLYTSPAFHIVDIRLRRLTQHVYVAVNKVRTGRGTYSMYAYHLHLYGDDVLRYMTSIAIRLDSWYNFYDTLYGISRDHSLALSVSIGNSSRKRFP